MRTARLLAVLLTVGTVLGLTQAAASAAGTTASQLALTAAPSTAPAGSTSTLTTTLTGSGGPLDGRPVVFEHLVSGSWTAVGEPAPTDPNGRTTLSVTVAATAAENTYRTRWAGDETYAPTTSPQVQITPEATAATLTGSAPGRGFVREAVPFAVWLRRPDGTPIRRATVEIQRRVDRRWGTVGTVTTDAEGRGSLDVEIKERTRDNRFRAEYAGPPRVRSASVSVEPVKQKSRLTVTGPDQVVDERTVTLTFSWRTKSDQPVPEAVTVLHKERGKWSTYKRRLRMGADGAAELSVRPRYDSAWKAVGAEGSWYRGDRSRVHTVDNLPPHAPVKLPKAAPKPRIKLPAQPRATGDGAHAVVSRIPNKVWRSMVGRSWHQGCPVGRSGLRLVRINYWGYDGYRHRGELVVRAAVTGKVVRAFGGMYRGGYPIRAMYRVDRFGWSKELHGANDRKSMSAGNTSAFNCRSVVGKPEVLSPHAGGRAIDINTWENPYRSRQGLVPNSWWQSHSHPKVAWRSREHPVVKILARAGLRWTYGLGDTQHFDA